MKRPGRAGGGGFYDYPAGEAKRLWPELKTLFEKPASSSTSTSASTPSSTATIEHLKQRLLYRQSIEAARCLAEGLVSSTFEANIGSIFGIGFPAWTGGALQFIESEGRERFIENADALAAEHGTRFLLSNEVRKCLTSIKSPLPLGEG